MVLKYTRQLILYLITIQQDKEPTDKEMNDKSPHILNASSNLLGLCFIVLTSLKVLNLTEATVIDELTAVAIIKYFIAY